MRAGEVLGEIGEVGVEFRFVAQAFASSPPFRDGGVVIVVRGRRGRRVKAF